MTRRTQHQGFTLLELMIVVGIIGVLSSIAVPNFMRFQAHAKQAEAKTNLKLVYTAQKSYFSEHDAYVESVYSMGFTPDRGNRYFYETGAALTNCQVRSAAKLQAPVSTSTCINVDLGRFPSSLAEPFQTGAGVPVMVTPTGTTAPPGVTGVSLTHCPRCAFAARATGNVDNDTGLDVWTISSVDMTLSAGKCWAATPVGGKNASGNALNLYNDVGC